MPKTNFEKPAIVTEIGNFFSEQEAKKIRSHVEKHKINHQKINVTIQR